MEALAFFFRPPARGPRWQGVHGVTLPTDAQAVRLAWAASQMAYLAVTTRADADLRRSQDGGAVGQHLVPHIER